MGQGKAIYGRKGTKTFIPFKGTLLFLGLKNFSFGNPNLTGPGESEKGGVRGFGFEGGKTFLGANILGVKTGHEHRRNTGFLRVLGQKRIHLGFGDTGSFEVPPGGGKEVFSF